MGLVLYEQEGCPWCAKVVDKLTDLDLEYESVWVESLHSTRDEVKQISGQRQVPVLVDEEHAVIMPESANIVDYLDRAYGSA